MKIRIPISHEAAFLIENPEMRTAFKGSASKEMLIQVCQELETLSEVIHNIVGELKGEK